MRPIDADELTEMVWRERLDTRERIANLIARQPTIKSTFKHGIGGMKMDKNMKIDKNKRYDIFVNTVDGIKDEYINVELFIDDIFIHVILADGRNIGYPINNVSRINYRETKMIK